jgi:hypothetical protein
MHNRNLSEWIITHYGKILTERAIREIEAIFKETAIETHPGGEPLPGGGEIPRGDRVDPPRPFPKQL